MNKKNNKLTEKLFGLSGEDWMEISQKLDEQFADIIDEIQYDKYGFTVSPEDDEFFGYLYEHLLLNEKLLDGDFELLNPGSIVFVTLPSDDGVSGDKHRPMLILHRSGSSDIPRFRGFEITKQGPDRSGQTGQETDHIGDFRIFRTRLIHDIKINDIIFPQYVKYGHIVDACNEQNPEIRYYKPLVQDDFKHILADIKKNYEKLITWEGSSYEDPNQKIWLDRFVGQIAKLAGQENFLTQEQPKEEPAKEEAPKEEPAVEQPSVEPVEEPEEQPVEQPKKYPYKRLVLNTKIKKRK